jgi:hypothetical protein
MVAATPGGPLVRIRHYLTSTSGVWTADMQADSSTAVMAADRDRR